MEECIIDTKMFQEVCRVSPKVGLFKRRVQESCGQRRNQKLQPGREKHIVKEKSSKTGGLGTLFRLQMRPKCTPRCGGIHIRKWKCKKTQGPRVMSKKSGSNQSVCQQVSTLASPLVSQSGSQLLSSSITQAMNQLVCQWVHQLVN